MFTGLQQEGESFATWRTQVREQADKCDFIGYNFKMATRDAIIFQTRNIKMKKRVLAEDLDLAAVIKMVLAIENSKSKADGEGSHKKDDDSDGRRMTDLEETVVRLKLQKKSGP